MALLTNEQEARMLANGHAAAEAIAEDGNTPDVFPVVKLFTPWGGATWLLSELDPGDEDIAFGLCDLGFECLELGSVRLSELEAVRGPGGLAVERDLHFRPTKSLTAYAAEANRFGRIRAGPVPPVSGRDGRALMKPKLSKETTMTIAETGKAWSTSRDWERINLSLAKMEKEFEFTPVDHWGIEKGMERELAREKARRKRREPEIGEKQRALREKNKPLIPIGVEDRAPKIRELSAIVRAATSWKGLDKALSDVGFSLRVKGQGLILTDGSHYVKLSQLGKDIQLERLEERFDQAFESFDLEKARALEKDRRVRMPKAPEPPNTDGMTPYDRRRALEMYERAKEVFEARARRIGMTDDPISDLDIADGELRMWIDAEATHKGARRRMRQLEREEFGLVARSDRSREGLERKKDLFIETMGKVFTDPLAAAERWSRIETARGRDEAEKLMMQQPAAFGDLKGWNLPGLKTPERKQAERAWRKLIERRRAYQFAIDEQEAHWNLLRDTRARLTAARQRYEILTFRENALEPLPQIITSLIRKRMVALERVTEEMIWRSNLASDRKEQLEAALRKHKEKKRDLARSRELERETGVYRDFFRAKKPEKHLELGERRDRDRERDIDD